MSTKKKEKKYEVVDPLHYEDGAFYLRDPQIRIYRDFLSETQIAELLRFVENKKFKESVITEDHDEERQVSAHRTSKTYFLPLQHALTRQIKRKVADLLQCRMMDVG